MLTGFVQAVQYCNIFCTISDSSSLQNREQIHTIIDDYGTSVHHDDWWKYNLFKHERQTERALIGPQKSSIFCWGSLDSNKGSSPAITWFGQKFFLCQLINYHPLWRIAENLSFKNTLMFFRSQTVSMPQNEWMVYVQKGCASIKHNIQNCRCGR